jgi:penicillin amidase
MYNEWRSEILRKTLLDELGPERFNIFCSLADAWHFYKRLIENPASRWWDDIQTKDHVETREEIVTQAFKQAIAVLTFRFGSNVNNWTWGKLHTVEYVHVLGRQKPLNFFFNAGPYPAGGNYSQVDAMAPAPRGQETFDVISGPSTRRIIDFSHIEKSWGINPLGNSGNLMSRHEKDQAGPFLRGQYRPELMDSAEIQRTAETTLLLLPL